MLVGCKKKAEMENATLLHCRTSKLYVYSRVYVQYTVDIQRYHCFGAG